MSDIHLDPANRSASPAPIGKDTNGALLDSALAEMKRIEPAPPVVVIAGDFLAHRFDYARAIPTMQNLAARFDRAFPSAQFIIALGNEDAGRADYAFAPDSAFSKAAAAAWAPLVNRRGAAPGFLASFAHDGFYVARLPFPNATAVVVNDVFWSPFYRSRRARGSGARMLSEIHAALRRTPSGQNWIVAHIPPGIDAYSTAQLAHSLVVVPFLQPVPRAAFLSLIADPANHVSLVVAGHTHKFAYRVAGTSGRPVPLLLVPAVSPIFHNAPSFLSARLDASGRVREATIHAFLENHWTEIGSTRSLGLEDFSGENLLRLQGRLANDPALRATFARLYEGGAPPEITERNWRTYWCAAATFAVSDFRKCTGGGGFGIVTGLGIWLAALAAVACIVILIFFALGIYRWSSRAGGSG